MFATLYDEASTVIAQRISQIAGVGQVLVVGSVAAGGAHRAESQPACTATASACRAVQQRRQRAELESRPRARSPIGNTTADIIANDQISKAADYKPLVIGYHNGGAVRLSDVADVVDSQQTLRQAGFLNGKPSVNMLIFRQPGANIITTVDARQGRAAVARRRPFPRGEHIVTILDRTLTIRASVSRYRADAGDLGAAGDRWWFSFSCASLRATLIPGVAVPVSLIGTCARHVPVRLFTRQPVAHGAGDLRADSWWTTRSW